MRSALIVFAKIPAAGHVKTRLTPDIEAGEAAELYDAFLRDLLARFVRIGVDIRLYLAPRRPDWDEDARRPMVVRGNPTGIRRSDTPVDSVPAGVTVHEQEGRDLGDRMVRAFFETFAAGYERIVITGCDHPTLPNAFIEYAFESLAQPKSVVLGPADDGGYYLVGMNEFFPELFRKMEYSRPDVLVQTLERLPTAEIDVTLLPFWYDIDTADDLRRLAAELATAPEVHPCTRDVLARLSLRYPWITAGRRAEPG